MPSQETAFPIIKSTQSNHCNPYQIDLLCTLPPPPLPWNCNRDAREKQQQPGVKIVMTLPVSLLFLFLSILFWVWYSITVNGSQTADMCPTGCSTQWFKFTHCDEDLCAHENTVHVNHLNTVTLTVLTSVLHSVFYTPSTFTFISTPFPFASLFSLSEMPEQDLPCY